ncbi:Phenoloxidase-activating factor 2 [Pseudolycoriella hygida]|uniref:Phenoloxidase-activating factor 2 n=1 Tax=Pseudolycoriella hygida TaxID=35572 RepID=A0A9Q0SA10_9DIPT|nr:Phenoloxidase-activating factor 2 [Pseudolycoriella hygida]
MFLIVILRLISISLIYPSVIGTPLPSTTSENMECIGVCVSKEFCENGLTKSRIDDQFLNAIVCQEPEICCKFEEKKETTEGSIVFEIEDDENELEATNHQCGIRHSGGIQPRISDDDGVAEDGEFPWMVAILTEGMNMMEYMYTCGGSLIHPSVVLTAAHCVNSVEANKLLILAGDRNLSGTHELHSRGRYVSSILIHKKFQMATLFNDVALLFLETPFKLTENVRTICLPPPKYQLEGASCFVSGWGKDSMVGKYQEVLKKAQVPVVSKAKCEQQLRQTILGKHFRLHRSFLCGEAGFGDACKGDGGSPLVCYNVESDSFYQAGIVSWGLGCGEKNIPAGYANVSALRLWIDKGMRRKKLY